jgi:6-phosphogluconolactonase
VTGPARVVVHPDAALLAEAVAARLVTRLLDAQARRGHAHLVLTGGGAGIAALAAVRSCRARDAVDWSALDVWWGDERFLPREHADRNALQARRALLDHVPIPPERVHEMPALHGRFGEDLDAAAAGYAAVLAEHAAPGDGLAPPFDVLLLGVGPDGHVASLFPGDPALRSRDRSVVGVRNSPKPPPARVSLTLPVIRAARQVWLIAAGAEKAAAVGRALARDSALPAASARGRRRTLWLLDRAAAGVSG